MVADEVPPALTAARMIEAYKWTIRLSPSVVLVYDEGLVPAGGWRRGKRRGQHPFRHVSAQSPGVDIVVAAGPGSPVAAITIELLAALDVSRVVSVGSAGRLQPAPEAARPVVIERAESDEGTSAQYGEHLSPDAELTRILLDRFGRPGGIALTTDVPFRHTPARLAAHRRRADLVEMECAALFAAAAHLRIAAAAVVVPSDQFDGDLWSPLPRDPDLLPTTVAEVVSVLM